MILNHFQESIMELTEQDIQRYNSFLPQKLPDTCWEWHGAKAGQGYGQLRIKGHNISAHRIAYFLAHGKIPERMFILHSCDNPPCCNPAHLSASTQAQNLTEAWARGRRARKLNVPSNKLSSEIIQDIITPHLLIKHLCEKYNLTRKQIARIRKEKLSIAQGAEL